MIDEEGIKGGGLPISFIVRLEVGVPVPDSVTATTAYVSHFPGSC